MKPKISRGGANALFFGAFEAASALDPVVTTLMHQLGHDPGVTDYLVYVP
jgi:hypothetical protein